MSSTFSLQGVASATLNVEVRLHSYSNPTSEECDGGNCDGFFGTCDNHFTFCIGRVGSTSCLDLVIAEYGWEDDSITFTPAIVAELGLTNPLVFTGLDASVRMYETLLHPLLQNFCSLSFILCIQLE